MSTFIIVMHSNPKTRPTNSHLGSGPPSKLTWRPGTCGPRERHRPTLLGTYRSYRLSLKIPSPLFGVPLTSIKRCSNEESHNFHCTTVARESA